MTNKKFRTVYADPPWPERGGGRIKRGADNHYPVMKIKDIKAMGESLRPHLDESGCHLHLWATNNYLKQALEVMEAWGFRYVTMATWAKDRFGLGQYRRGQTEHLLFGVMGKLPYKVVDGKRVTVSTLIGGKPLPRSEHSRKPMEARVEIERMSYPPFLELFARQQYLPLFGSKHWHVWGNEVDSDIQL